MERNANEHKMSIASFRRYLEYIRKARDRALVLQKIFDIRGDDIGCEDCQKDIDMAIAVIRIISGTMYLRYLLTEKRGWGMARLCSFVTGTSVNKVAYCQRYELQRILPTLMAAERTIYGE